MEIFVTFPRNSWCEERSEELGRFLARKFDMEYIEAGLSGYAWNDYSYWKVESASAKPKVLFEQIHHLLIEPSIEYLSSPPKEIIVVSGRTRRERYVSRQNREKQETKYY